MSSSPNAHVPSWMLDELAAAGRENLDAVHVSRYDEKEPWPAEEEVRLAEGLGLSPDSVVVDLGAGTGQFALAAAPRFRRVVAVDVSEVMLEVLRRKVDQARHDNVEVELGGFLTYRHRRDAADLVYSRYALHHLPDFWKALALRNIHSMLRPGGVLRLWDIVYSFEPAAAEERLEAWCSTLDDASGFSEWVRADIEEHIRDEHSTFSWVLEPMLARAGFAVEEAEYSEDRIFAKYVLRRA
ncbi:class I SAM-dependent methyltransferase [Naasia sp. SYSU D00948]|uniref:class I SAM-dependent methyltransferase n=1 Tax=Naasia sp. SYSU D00948 TaxID=2817379 RepID=UPI001B3093BF|nr:class I SAM-dependent methyltransferase [Naasia sp. SYSU D00948]